MYLPQSQGTFDTHFSPTVHQGKTDTKTGLIGKVAIPPPRRTINVFTISLILLKLLLLFFMCKGELEVSIYNVK